MSLQPRTLSLREATELAMDGRLKVSTAARIDWERGANIPVVVERSLKAMSWWRGKTPNIIDGAKMLQALFVVNALQVDSCLRSSFFAAPWLHEMSDSQRARFDAWMHKNDCPETFEAP